MDGSTPGSGFCQRGTPHFHCWFEGLSNLCFCKISSIHSKSLIHKLPLNGCLHWWMKKFIETLKPPHSYWFGNRSQWAPFMGFGNTQSPCVEYLSRFQCPLTVEMVQPMSIWKKKIIEKLKEVYWIQAEYTEIAIKDSEISDIVIDGHQKLKARFYLYCDSPKSLLRLLPKNCLPHLLCQKISKSQTMTSLLLLLKYQKSKQKDSKKSLYFFLGTKDHEPFMGQVSSHHPSCTFFVWQSLLPDKSTETPETMGTQIRYMRRQIKRSFPDPPNEEKIIVVPESHGYMKLNHPTSLKNLWQSSPLTQKEDGMTGHLKAAYSLYKELQPLITQ